MSGLGLASLVEEGNVKNLSGLVPRESAKNHLGHGCCQDPASKGSRSLIGVRPLAMVPNASSIGPVNIHRPTAVVLALRCRSWRCACCVPRLLRRNRARAIRGAMAGGWVWMLTLTIDPLDPRWIAYVREAVAAGGVVERGGRLLPLGVGIGDDGRMATAALSLRYAARAWNHLRTQLRNDRGLKGRVSFYTGRELHKNGMAHLHVLVRARVASPWLMTYGRLWQLASAAGFGRIDVQRARRGEAVGRYVAKAAGIAGAASEGRPAGRGGTSGLAASIVAGYGSKSADALPRWTRRGSWSPSWCEDWTAPTPLAGFAWRLGGASASFTAEALGASGFIIEDPARYRVNRADRPGAGEGVETWQN